jgi:hypothetical protein
MAGGVIAGIFFGKISAKLKDMILVLACCLLLERGYILLSFFNDSLALILISVSSPEPSLSLFIAPQNLLRINLFQTPQLRADDAFSFPA